MDSSPFLLLYCNHKHNIHTCVSFRVFLATHVVLATCFTRTTSRDSRSCDETRQLRVSCLGLGLGLGLILREGCCTNGVQTRCDQPSHPTKVLRVTLPLSQINLAQRVKFVFVSNALKKRFAKRTTKALVVSWHPDKIHRPWIPRSGINLHKQLRK